MTIDHWIPYSDPRRILFPKPEEQEVEEDPIMCESCGEVTHRIRRYAGRWICFGCITDETT